MYVMYVCMYVCMYACMYVCMYVYFLLFLYIYIVIRYIFSSQKTSKPWNLPVCPMEPHALRMAGQNIFEAPLDRGRANV